MLEPDARHLLLDALRPPLGYTLDMAVGTTYSLDLIALMTAPVAFALFDRQRGDGSPIDDPIATLQALREHADRITLFCQAGQIAVPAEFRSLLVYLEHSVYPVVPPHPEAIFHPKVWYIRYRHVENGSVSYRLLCLSRNLTFDRSWDTVLRLEGTIGDQPRWTELERFAGSLMTMAQRTRPLPSQRIEALRSLGQQFARANWTLPEHFTEIRFWPLGDDGQERWPFEGRRDRMLVVSPFVTHGSLQSLTGSRAQRGSILVSRPETIDALGGAATAHLAERLVLSSDAAGEADTDAGADVTMRQPNMVTESTGHGLMGLHAKTYVADAGWRARVWTGSANATDAAFHGNVEFMVELGGQKERVGVHATIGDHADRLGLRKLVEPYQASQEQPLSPSDAELIERRLDRARRVIGGFRFTAGCAAIEPDHWQLTLTGVAATAPSDAAILDGIAATIRPVTLGRGFAVTPSLNLAALQAVFNVSEPSITPYFAITLALDDVEIAFVVAAELIDPPLGRAERVLSSLLANRADLIRFLLLLLGNIDDALAAFDADAGATTMRGSWLAGYETEALLEPLVRAYSRDPQRLRDIERVLKELDRSSDRQSILPEGWAEIWDPIAAALAEEACR